MDSRPDKHDNSRPDRDDRRRRSSSRDGRRSRRSPLRSRRNASGERRSRFDDDNSRPSRRDSSRPDKHDNSRPNKHDNSRADNYDNSRSDRYRRRDSGRRSPSLSNSPPSRRASSSRSPPRRRNRRDLSSEDGSQRKQKSSRWSSDESDHRRGRRRRGRYREDRRKRFERPLEGRLTKIVAIRNVPLDATEDAIESTVRDSAISLGFSPPNSVKLMPNVPGRTPVELKGSPQLSEGREANTTSAFVDFPSIEAAEVFVEACRREFTLGGKRVKLEQTRLYVGNVGTLSAGDSSLEWVCISCANVNRNGCPICLQCRNQRLVDCPTVAPSGRDEELGPCIPCPEMYTFSVDSRSGMLYSESSGLYYDQLTQQYISVAGVYYMKSTSVASELVPVFRMGSSMFGGSGAQSFPEMALALLKPQPEPEEPDATMEQVDPETHKATAIASILATAQLAAKQMKKTKKPTAADSFEEASGVVVMSQKKTGPEAPIPQIDILTMFGEEEKEELPPTPPPVLKQAVLSYKGESKPAALPTPTAMSDSRPPIDVARICYICLRQFDSSQKLARHELSSKLHKKNSELQGAERGMV